MAEYSGPSSLPQVQSLSQTSEEGEEEQSHQNGRPFIRSIKPRLALNDGPTAVAEGANRRPRGRPPGSKNKPKPAVVLTTRDGDAGMKAAVLEIAAGSDVIDTVVQFGRRRQLGGVTIMSASGSVFNVTLRNPISHAPSLTLHGKFNIISITGTFLGSSPPSSSSSANSSSSGGSCSFGITLAGQQGHVLGGVVSGNVTAANKVVLVVATFMNPSFHRLPGADLVVHDGGDDHGNPNLGGAGHGCVGTGGSEGCSNTSMSISGHGVSSPAPLNSLAPSDVVTWGGSTSLPHHPY